MNSVVEVFSKALVAVYGALVSLYLSVSSSIMSSPFPGVYVSLLIIAGGITGMLVILVTIALLGGIGD